jgi:histidyl-tRNA synthetase
LADKLKPRLYKGTRDFLPADMIRRNYVINLIKSIFEKFGFEPLETPTIEMWETLSGKYGEEADRLTYRFRDRGDREVGLRYDLTVPLSRVIAIYPQIPKPFKRYQIQPVWRADKPQKGRFREFYQCDADIIGSGSVLADAEIIAITFEILRKLQFEEFTIRVNSRKILAGITQVSGTPMDKELDICRAIDKMDKIGPSGVEKELTARGIKNSAISRILEIISIEGANSAKINQIESFLSESENGSEGIREIRDLLTYLSCFEIPETNVLFDLYLARGLDYYTGPIYETIVEKPKIGSITGGGRYDNLIGLFSGQPNPATGTTIGLERIIAVMEELNLFPENISTSVNVLVTVFDDTTLPYSVLIANLLRKEGINTDLYTGQSKLRGQIGLANEKGIPFVIIAGPDETERKTVNLKNMKSGEQKEIPLADITSTIRLETDSI